MGQKASIEKCSCPTLDNQNYAAQQKRSREELESQAYTETVERISTPLPPTELNSHSLKTIPNLSAENLDFHDHLPKKIAITATSVSHETTDTKSLHRCKRLDSFASSSSDDISLEDEEVKDWFLEDETTDTSAPPPAPHVSIISGISHQFDHKTSSESTGDNYVTGPASHMSCRHFSTVSSHSYTSSRAVGDEDEILEDEFMELTPFMLENMPIYEVMQQVQLFRKLSQNQQEQVLRALKPAAFRDGEIIVEQGTTGSRFYMIAKGTAVVTKKATHDIPSKSSIKGALAITKVDEEERMVTYLHAGHYFGELALIYDDPRTATVRAVGDVELLYLTQDDFQRIGQVHLSLMLQQVPLLARLNAVDQDAVLNRLKPANFNDGDYIVRQGEEGTRFYMITRGEAIVTEKVSENEEKELTRLYEGHVFGEMSLIYKEPRTASVIAVGPVKCLYLSQEDFDTCLLSDNFHRFIREAYVEKATRRAMRSRLRLQQKELVNTFSSGSPTSSQLGKSKKVSARETSKLVKHRLKNGQKVVNKYVILQDLGKGTFGRVKLCKSEIDSKLYAVKIMHKTFVQRMTSAEDKLQDALKREVAIMKKLSHQNVVKLVEVIDDPSSQKVYLVQEYVQTNLMDEIESTPNGLDEETARKYMRDLLCGLRYLHQHNVIHQDLKPANILVTSDGLAKIADFGTARILLNELEPLSGAIGTPAFMAPEMFEIDAQYIGPAVDVWSLGATLYMMVVGHPPWLAGNEIVLSEKVQRDELQFSGREMDLEPHLRHLLKRMLTKDYARRPTVQEIFTHDWITKEGSEPLIDYESRNTSSSTNSGHSSLLTVSMDESEDAIQKIPEHIDQRLTSCLEKAHRLVKSKADAKSSSISTYASNPELKKRVSTDATRIIGAWRHHRRTQLIDSHVGLSQRIRDLLLEQKQLAVSADRAEITELIFPATPSRSSSGNRTVGSLNNAVLSRCSSRSASIHSPNEQMNRPDNTNPQVKGISTSEEFEDYKNFTKRTPSFTENISSSNSDIDLLTKRPLERKKDFLMVTSEVFVDEDGDYKSRKILFTGRTKDFSVVSGSSLPTKRSKGELRNSSSSLTSNSSSKQLRDGDSKTGLEKHDSHLSIKSVNSVQSSSNGSSSHEILSKAFKTRKSIQTTSMADRRNSTSTSLYDVEVGIDGIVHVEEEGEDDGDSTSHLNSDALSQESNDTDAGSDDSDYSVAESDVDINETFDPLMSGGRGGNSALIDDELLPLSPKTTKHGTQVYVSSKTRENLALGIRCGYAEAKGSRAYMEDKTVIFADVDIRKYPQLPEDENLAFFAIYDGHNGDDTASFLQRELHHAIFSRADFRSSKPAMAVSGACGELDKEILEIQSTSVYPRITSKMGNVQDHKEIQLPNFDTGIDMNLDVEPGNALQPMSFSGSTAVIFILSKNPNSYKTLLTTTNVGDSRAVLCTSGGIAVDLTVDHKASLESERQRIEEAGGFVHNGRLNGILALSRGFGDLAYKQEGYLIVEPDIQHREVLDTDEFLLMASDGLFDVFSSQEAVSFVRRKIVIHGDVQLAAQETVLKAQEYGSADNVSVVIVALNQKSADR